MSDFNFYTFLVRRSLGEGGILQTSHFFKSTSSLAFVPGALLWGLVGPGG